MRVNQRFNNYKSHMWWWWCKSLWTTRGASPVASYKCAIVLKNHDWKKGKNNQLLIVIKLCKGLFVVSTSIWILLVLLFRGLLKTWRAFLRMREKKVIRTIINLFRHIERSLLKNHAPVRDGKMYEKTYVISRWRDVGTLRSAWIVVCTLCSLRSLCICTTETWKEHICPIKKKTQKQLVEKFVGFTVYLKQIIIYVQGSLTSLTTYLALRSEYISNTFYIVYKVFGTIFSFNANKKLNKTLSKKNFTWWL